MNLIDEGFSGWWRKYSALALALIGCLQIAWAGSDDVQKMLSPQALNAVSGALAWLGFFGRFIKQTQQVLP